jgi:hypothetical protein
MLATIPITFDDLLNAAILAAVILMIIRLLGWGFRTLLTRTREIAFDPNRADEVRKRCSRLFPIEILNFNGTTVQRGCVLRIITNQQDSIEGEFLGTNRSDMLCLVTNETVIAQELQTIETIQVIRKAAKPV